MRFCILRRNSRWPPKVAGKRFLLKLPVHRSYTMWAKNFVKITLSRTVSNKAAKILRLLRNETIQLNTRGKKSEPGLRKQLNKDIKSTTKFYFFLQIYEYIYIFY